MKAPPTSLGAANVVMHPATGTLRPIFIGGCPRSGTTLLGALIGAHSRCVCVPEMQFKVYPMHRAFASPEGLTSREVARLIEYHPYFQNWGISAGDDTRPDGTRLTYRQAVDDLVRRYATAVALPNADVWADHSPQNIVQTRTLLERFPDATILHIVRDGRGVAASLFPLRWSVNTVFAAATVWAEHIAHGLAAELAHPERVHRVQYEELVRDPQRVMRRICDVTKLEWEPQLGTVTRFRVPSATAHQHPNVSRPPDPSRADAWRTSLTRRQIEIFESISGSLLANLGYPLEFEGQAAPPSKQEKLRATLGELYGQLERLGWRAFTDLGARLRPSARSRSA